MLCKINLKMAHANIRKIKVIRQQLVAETGSFPTDWHRVQVLLDELMVNHQQYKQFAIKNNIHLYS